jgi:hypothetical protein
MRYPLQRILPPVRPLAYYCLQITISAYKNINQEVKLKRGVQPAEKRVPVALASGSISGNEQHLEVSSS